MLGVHALLAALAARTPRRRTRERRLGEHAHRPRRATAPASARTSAAMPAVDQLRSRSRPAANISPVYGQSSSIAACIRACDSSVPSPSRITQSADALDVVGDLLRRLGGDLGDARVAPTARARAAASRCQASNRNWRAIVSAKLPFGCSTSSRLRNSPASRRNASWSSSRPGPDARLDLARVGEPQPRLPEEVEPDVGERDVLLEDRARCPPTRRGAARGPGRVAEAQQVFEEVRVERSVDALRADARRAVRASVVARPSQVLHFVGHREERRMPVDLAVRRLEQRVAGRRATTRRCRPTAPPRSTRPRCAACRRRARS